MASWHCHYSVCFCHKHHGLLLQGKGTSNSAAAAATDGASNAAASSRSQGSSNVSAADAHASGMGTGPGTVAGSTGAGSGGSAGSGVGGAPGMTGTATGVGQQGYGQEGYELDYSQAQQQGSGMPLGGAAGSNTRTFQ